MTEADTVRPNQRFFSSLLERAGPVYNSLFTDREPPLPTTEAERITQLLQSAKTIAVVGLTDTPMRPSYGVSHYMQSQGYRIIPVNPNIHGVDGREGVSIAARCAGED